MKKLEFYAGVPHLKGDAAFNRSLGNIVRATTSNHSNSFGGFSALFDFKPLNFKDPLLVATTDGVGTKLELAELAGKYDTIGIDLVAMSVNDLITCGAQPVLFLDYFASGTFDRKKTLSVVRGIAQGCREAGCALLGGETAIMPGFYPGAKYDLAGFSVGFVERSKVIHGKSVRAGDQILGLASSGFHSNGYSLVRKVFTKKELSGKVGQKLLTPTKIYVKPVLDVISKVNVHAIANITGGGIYDNLPRVLPKGLGARIYRESWPINPLFLEVQKRARYSNYQMAHTFNMGIGMVLVLSESDVRAAKKILLRHGVTSWEIGVIEKQNGILIDENS